MAQGIDVSTIFPGAIESEIWETTENRTGLDMASVPPKFPRASSPGSSCRTRACPSRRS